MAFYTERNRIERGKFGHILMNYSGPSFSDLPRDIMVNVFARLSIKRIIVCKIVCKTWHDFISNPDFAKLHFDRAQAYPLFQLSGYTVRSRILYLLQPEEELSEHKLEMCDHSEYNSLIKFELDTKLKLPFRNLQMIFDDEDSIPNNRINVLMKNHKYRVVNSCNGMLCLSSPYDYDNLVVCNPVTSEFINLPNPEVKQVDLSRGELCGFGFSPKTNQYKVVRIFPHLKSIGTIIRVKVHTIGTETWKAKDFATASEVRELYSIYRDWIFAIDPYASCPTYLNGFLYWPCDSNREYPLYFISFDIDNECFRPVLATPIKYRVHRDRVTVGELGGELCISCCFESGVIEVWVMKDCGTTNMWSKVFSFHINCYYLQRFGPWKPVKFLSDGALLMFNSVTNCLVYIHPTKYRLLYIKFCDLSAQLELTAHIPSFVPLKDALSGHNVNVLKPRCAKLKLRNEDKGISVQETHEPTLVSRHSKQDICEIVMSTIKKK